MKLVFLTAFIVTLALVHEGLGVPPTIQPCQQRTNEQAYQVFEHRHIIPDSMATTSSVDWSNYLRSRNLCGRFEWQAFIRASPLSVQDICSNTGRLVQGANCMSSSRMGVYRVKSDIDCNVSGVQPLHQYVVVSCVMAGQNCRPVHYVGAGNQGPSATPCRSP